jgi:hypothetical protein
MATVAALALICGLAAAIAVMSGGLGGQFQSMGNHDAPEADAATGLYFSLNDMDAQVANVLLVGRDRTLAADRSQDLAIYASDRATADQDLQQATVIAAGDEAAQRELRKVLDGVGQYETLAADALLTDAAPGDGTAPGDRAAKGGAPIGGAPIGGASTAGKATAAALGYYRQATDLMRASVLPSVGSLTAVSAAALDRAYDSDRATALTGIAAITVAGLLLLAVLAALQLFLHARFRRVVNPALVMASLITLAVTVAAVARLGAEDGHLKVAKQDAFDSILALTQARAVSYDANADESRYLVDPGRAAQYQQAFLAKSQRMAAVGNVGIFGYDGALAADVRAYQGDNSDVRFGGYLGAEFRNITFPGERAAAVRTLLAYQRYERDDRVLRSKAGRSLAAAVAFDVGTAPGQSNWAFNQYDAALSSVIAINQNAFTAAVQAGEGGAAGWGTVFPMAGAALIAALVLAGVRPRLAEYSLG